MLPQLKKEFISIHLLFVHKLSSNNLLNTYLFGPDC